MEPGFDGKPRLYSGMKNGTSGVKPVPNETKNDRNTHHKETPLF